MWLREKLCVPQSCAGIFMKIPAENRNWGSVNARYASSKNIVRYWGESIMSRCNKDEFISEFISGKYLGKIDKVLDDSWSLLDGLGIEEKESECSYIYEEGFLGSDRRFFVFALWGLFAFLSAWFITTAFCRRKSCWVLCVHTRYFRLKWLALIDYLLLLQDFVIFLT